MMDDFDGGSRFGILGYEDSYSKKVFKQADNIGFVHFLIDKLSLKFNLATCFARMSSRMDLSWNETTNFEKGVLQASYLYQKSAGVYQDIKT